MKSRWFALLAVLIVLFIGAYFGICVVLYNRLATVLPDCDGQFIENSPPSFNVERFTTSLDTSRYAMPIYENVQISSRDPGITLSGWFVPADAADAPTVLVVHGLGVGTADCKRNPHALLAAGMLHRANFNVLLIDLREHGSSTIEDGFWAGNTEEYRDVLGAWDWLVNVRGIAPQQIGLFAYSGGTGAALIAMGEEPRVQAAWLDSVYLDIPTSIGDQLAKMGYPRLLVPGGLLLGRLHGDNLTAFSPLRAAARITGRPVLIAHSDADTVLSVDYAYRLRDAMEAAGTSPELWVIHGGAHVRAMFDQPAEYERRLAAFFNASLQTQ